MNRRPQVVVAGHGMAGHRLVEELVGRGVTATHDVAVIGEERWPAYDRVNLSTMFAGADRSRLTLPPGAFEDRAVRLHLDEAVNSVDRQAGVVTTSRGRRLGYDLLILATGAAPLVPPVSGLQGPGCLTYRTIEDVATITEMAASTDRAVVIGGGLLGLEAAGALRSLHLEVSVVEAAPHLMATQLDAGAGEALRRAVELLGVTVLVGSTVQSVGRDDDGRLRAVQVINGQNSSEIRCGLVLIAAGVRPRDELARQCALAVAPRGGVLVDQRCRTDDPRVLAIGECAAPLGRWVGLAAPGHAMARVVAATLAGDDAQLDEPDTSAALKLCGVDVACAGDVRGESADALDVVYANPVAGTYAKLRLSDDARTLLGVALVGNAEPYGLMRSLVASGAPLPGPPEQLILPAGSGTANAAEGLDDSAPVCTCNGVCAGTVRSCVAGGVTDIAAVKTATRAGTSCGSCVPLAAAVMKAEMRRHGMAVSSAICEHLPFSRRELFELIRVRQITSFAALLREHGQGRGCDICKPAVASILASQASAHILDGEGASLQDTNDHFLANLQRDGSYSVVPRLPGGEVTPEKLIAIAEVARDFNLYCKITGGQRIDLFGAHVDQLPAIWRRLVDAGLESGHAYGKALRTVKSCVGSTWCRFGVQDSVAMAVLLENRYKGLRAPHKLKSAVSGCARECAEAQGKDFGVIATEKGWNLYVGGNGGFRPRRAELLATDLDDATLIRTIDRFLMFYIRTADRLQRTAPWLEALEGGVEHLRRVLIEDSLGIGAELDADMERHVAGYRCEWRETVEDPERLSRFVSFVNAPGVRDPMIARVPEREQIRPPRPGERGEGQLVPGAGLTGADGWTPVCSRDRLAPNRGVAAIVDGEQVAVFRTSEGELFAIGNSDPRSGANVMSRGIVGSRGDIPVVIAPVYKQAFDLRTGICVDDPSQSVPVYSVRCSDTTIEVAAGNALVPAGPASGRDNLADAF